MSLHRNRGAKRAREAREQLGLDPAAPVPCLLTCVEEQAELPVIVAPLAEGVAGACTQGRLLWVNGTHAAVRQRFTLAHELGHVRCGHDAGFVVDDIATVNGRTTNPNEIQANAFAAEFLLPRAALDTEDPSLDEVVSLAARYGTSAHMTVIRFRQHKLAGEERVTELLAAIEAGEHGAAYERLGCAPFGDRLGARPELPYLSESLRGSRLGAALRGDAAAEPELATAITRLLAA